MKKEISQDDIYYALDHMDSLSDLEKERINAQMRLNHKKKQKLDRRKIRKKWWKENGISIAALFIAAAAFIKSFF